MNIASITMRWRSHVLGLCALLLFIAAQGNTWASEVSVYIFWRDGCPHCERELTFLDRLQADVPDVRIQRFEIWNEAANRALFIEVGARLQADISAVPFTVVGDQVFSGYLDDASTGAQIKARALYCLAQACPDSVRELLAARDATRAAEPPRTTAATLPRLPDTIQLPLLGAVDLTNLSLPMLTVLLAALDGFNPCAMWTLIMLLGLLVGMKDRKRRWLLGTTFIAASAAVYFLFLSAWLNLFLFVGMLVWVRVAIGIVALAGGGYYLREYVLRRDAVCAVTSGERRSRFFERLKQWSSHQQLSIALLGIVALAFAVNLVEALCSAGIPAIYTQVLALNHLPTWQYYSYLLLYILIFMLDDLIVFFTVMRTLELTGLDTRYARYAHLLGGIVLVVIGALLLLRPEWLMFG